MKTIFSKGHPEGLPEPQVPAPQRARERAGRGGRREGGENAPPLPPQPIAHEEKEGRVPPPRGTRKDLDKCLLMTSKGGWKEGLEGGRREGGSGNQTRPGVGQLDPTLIG